MRDRRTINQPCRLCHDTSPPAPLRYFRFFISIIIFHRSTLAPTSIAINRARRGDET